MFFFQTSFRKSKWAWIAHICISAWDEEVDRGLVTGLHTQDLDVCCALAEWFLKNKWLAEALYLLPGLLPLAVYPKPFFFKKIKWRRRLSCAAAMLVLPGFSSWRFCLMFREFYSEIWNWLLSGVEESYYLCSLHDTFKKFKLTYSSWWSNGQLYRLYLKMKNKFFFNILRS